MAINCCRVPLDCITTRTPTQKMKDWIIDCTSNHEDCNSRSSITDRTDSGAQQLPTRVLRIQGSIEEPVVHLQENSAVKTYGKYVALSYCWGRSSDQYILLTTSSINALTKGIDFKKLPKTYQDAITTTITLELEYLWIDALCILQDQIVDWDTESQKMDQYYGNSIITLCVDSAEGLEAGFLEPKRSGLFDPLHIRQTLPSGERGNLLISRHMYTHKRWDTKINNYTTGLWRANVEICPLATRAWALQERFLSPRKLHFGAEDTFWECRQHRDAEGGISSLGKDPKLYELARRLAKGSVTAGEWYELVEMYSERNLTKRSDTLQAISGLAKAFNACLAADYRAGLWMHDLHYGLAWIVEGRSSREQTRDATFPTWSWASVQSGVVYSNGPGHTEGKCGFELVSIPETSHPYTGVPTTPISLFGRLRGTVLRSTYPQDIFPPSDLPDMSGQAASNGGVGEYRDDILRAREGDHYLTFRLFEVKPTQGPSLPILHFVLVLERVEDSKPMDSLFRRVGAAFIFHDTWFDGCAEQQVNLV